MPADICDLDRTYAALAVKAHFVCHVVQVAERMRQGDCIQIHAPDARTHVAVAAIFAELREAYLTPARARRDAAAGVDHDHRVGADSPGVVVDCGECDREVPDVGPGVVLGD